MSSAPRPSKSSALINRAVMPTPITVPPETALEEAIAKMSASKSSCIIVTQHKQAIGIFTERDLVKLIATEDKPSDTTIAAAMTWPIKTICITDVKDAFNIFQTMQQQRLRHLPVVKTNGQLAGLITTHSLRKALTPSTILKLKRVENVMETEVVCAPTTVNVKQLAQQMTQASVSCVVILASDQRPIGIVTERDIVKFQAMGLDMANTTAKTIMSQPLLPVHPKDSLWHAHQQMNQHRVRRFVVSSIEGKLAGLITQSSLLQALDPIEGKQMVALLQQEIELLRLENQTLLEIRNQELEKEQASLNEKLKNEQYQRQQAYAKLDQINAQLKERILARNTHSNQAEHHWQTLLENVQLAVIGINREGCVTYANPFFLHLSGYSYAEVTNLNWVTSFVPPAERSEIQTYFKKLYDQKPHDQKLYDQKPHDQKTYDQTAFSLQHQHPILTKSGELRVIAWHNTLLKNPEGQTIGTMSIGEDMTDRLAIDKLKSDFVAMVSHELRMPLTSIHGGIQLLSQGMVPSHSEKGQRLLQTAAESSERLVRLVSEILTLEQLDSGTTPLQKQLINTQTITQPVIDSFEVLAEKAHVTVEVSDPGFQIMADSDRLKQVLTNLLDNALKFSPPHTTIRITVQQDGHHQKKNQSNSTLCISVCDQGIGIPSDKQHQVFERFTQISRKNVQAKGGTGLGLAICRNIIEQHGGNIWVDSTLNQGSCFHFTLPQATRRKQ